ncbi:rab gdp/gtp exchange factor [Anaeramoeba flamelloides]|uniref:Rab gdp/gtp exchange factor n=1 Tax=Anaeramoeba flamelloides TaxID=1746091 RepID=A0ABQ8ZF53_9EUKA|nr:rab gdp/gtp exchange factor [Anaeramoeba flamelloides]
MNISEHPCIKLLFSNEKNKELVEWLISTPGTLLLPQKSTLLDEYLCTKFLQAHAIAFNSHNDSQLITYDQSHIGVMDNKSEHPSVALIHLSPKNCFSKSTELNKGFEKIQHLFPKSPEKFLKIYSPSAKIIRTEDLPIKNLNKQIRLTIISEPLWIPPQEEPQEEQQEEQQKKKENKRTEKSQSTKKDKGQNQNQKENRIQTQIQTDPKQSPRPLPKPKPKQKRLSRNQIKERLEQIKKEKITKVKPNKNQKEPLITNRSDEEQNKKDKKKEKPEEEEEEEKLEEKEIETEKDEEKKKPNEKETESETETKKETKTETKTVPETDKEKETEKNNEKTKKTKTKTETELAQKLQEEQSTLQKKKEIYSEIGPGLEIFDDFSIYFTNQEVRKLLEETDHFCQELRRSKERPNVETPGYVFDFIADISEYFPLDDMYLEIEDEEDKLLKIRVFLLEYIMRRISSRVFYLNEKEDKKKDYQLSERLEKLKFITFEHLDIEDDKFNEKILKESQEILKRINEVSTPNQKLKIIRDTCVYLSKIFTDKLTSADDFLPILIYTVLHSNPPKLHSNLQFLEKFTDPDWISTNSYGYYYTQLFSSVYFLQNLTESDLTDVDPLSFNLILQRDIMNYGKSSTNKKFSPILKIKSKEKSTFLKIQKTKNKKKKKKKNENPLLKK